MHVDTHPCSVCTCPEACVTWSFWSCFLPLYKCCLMGGCTSVADLPPTPSHTTSISLQCTLYGRTPTSPTCSPPPVTQTHTVCHTHQVQAQGRACVLGTPPPTHTCSIKLSTTYAKTAALWGVLFHIVAPLLRHAQLLYCYNSCSVGPTFSTSLPLSSDTLNCSIAITAALWGARPHR